MAVEDDVGADVLVPLAELVYEGVAVTVTVSKKIKCPYVHHSYYHTAVVVGVQGPPLPKRTKRRRRSSPANPLRQYRIQTVMAQENKFDKLWETYVLCAY